MNKKNIIMTIFVSLFIFIIGQFSFATSIEPGSESRIVDFSNQSKGLYTDNGDFYYLLDTGIVATDYMYSLDGERYYFGNDGKMVKDEIVEYDGEKYYFDINGAMIKNRWITYEEIDPYDGTAERTSYYLGPTGRAYRATDGTGVLIKVIDGERFGFNVDGERLEGYVNMQGEELDSFDTYAYAECMYYFDPMENYAAAVGWHFYDGIKDTNEYDENDEMYLYFDEKTCRKLYSKQVGKYLYRNIDGQRYMFDENGVRHYEWYGKASSSVAPKYFSADYDGFLAKGWFSAVPQADSISPKNREYNKSDEEKWFYADSTGKIVRGVIKKIGHYTYAFDEDGVMQSDALVVVKDGKYQRSYSCDDITRKQVVLAASEGGIINDGEYFMYFVEPEDENLVGSMCGLNRSIKIELADEEIIFTANQRGGYSSNTATSTIIKSGKYFQHGVLLKPINDNAYGIVRESLDATTSGYKKYVVVNKSGVLQTKYGSYKDKNGNYILTINNDGEYVGIFSVETRYTIANGWQYRLEGGNWITGFPPAIYKVPDSSYYINFEVYEGIANSDEYNIG